jgi:D-galactose 1-dehydrogenase
MTLRLAIVGLGKIARDQHVPAVAATAGIEIAAVASRNASLDGVPSFPTLDELLAKGPAVDAVALCAPPQVRRAQAAQALAAGKHVLLEKPPGATVSEIAPLAERAAERGLTLFATWHSRFAPAVEPARALLADRAIRAVRVAWKEDVRVWHPGQSWIWEPGGLGVFDPGINALSILTRILPLPFFLTQAELAFPENRAAPIAAKLSFETASGVPVEAELDWRQTGPQTWDIRIDTAEGPVVLTHGGSRLTVDGEPRIVEEDQEYRNLYRHFVSLVGDSRIDADFTPLVHVSDAFMLGRRTAVEAFED